MRNYIIVLAAAATFGLSGSAATAQPNAGEMKGMGDGPMQGMSHSDMKGMGSHHTMARNEFMAAMKKMDRGMMTGKGATTDIDFARMMLAHHQGAIDMAQIELKHGANAETKRMAQQIIEEQTKGKAELEAWLRAHGG